MSGEQVKIRQTTIERGVRVANASGESSDFSLVPVMAVAAMKQKHDHEKQVLHQLNDRFAKYVERVKFLESQNKKLLAELEELRQRWGEETRLIKDKYEPELLDARLKIDDATRDKAFSEIRSRRSEYDVLVFKRQYDDELGVLHLNKSKISKLEFILQENQSELDLLRRQLSDIEADIEKYKKEIQRLNAELQRLLDDLDEETLKRIKLENEKQTLEEQIPFLNAIHELEVAELRALNAALHIDPTAFYRHELERAIRDIRGDFEELSEQQKLELEEWYKLKTEEMYQQAAKRESDLLSSSTAESASSLRASLSQGQIELADLKKINAELIMRLSKLEEELEIVRRNTSLTLEQKEREISEIKAKLQELMGDYDELMSNKASLEFEINTYRRLLESEENRSSTIVSSSTTTSSTSSSKVSRPIPAPIETKKESEESQRSRLNSTNVESVFSNSSQFGRASRQSSSSSTVSNVPISLPDTNRTTFQRSAKGNISISESSTDGKVIVLENTSMTKEVSLSGWVLKRKVESGNEIVFKFPSNVTLKGRKTLKVWARGHGSNNLPNDLVNSAIDSWGFGNNVVTVLYNEIGDERATYLQKSL